LDSTASTYDANDRLTSDTYDSNGNTTTGHIPAGGSAVNDVYDFEDHLVNRNSGQVTVTYDGDGNRVAKTVSGVTTLFLVDDRNPSGYAQVLEEHTFTGTSAPALNRAYTYGSDLISEDQWTGSAWALNFYGYDGHGNVRYLTDTNAAVTDTYDYDAFGTLIAQSGTTQNNYLYCGEQFDADLGLYYNRARYLNVDTGRFWTQDDYEGKRFEPESLQKFLYVNHSPVDLVDSSGHDADRTDFLLDGILITRNIGSHFVNQKPNRLANYFPIGGIINRSEGYDDLSDDYLLSIGEFGFKPDLVDLDTREVWEVKSTRGILQADKDLVEYILILNAARKPGSKPWTPGISYTPPPFVRGLFRTADVYEQSAGVITYDPMIKNEELVYAVGFSILYKMSKLMDADIQGTLNTAAASSRF